MVELLHSLPIRLVNILIWLAMVAAFYAVIARETRKCPVVSECTEYRVCPCAWCQDAER